eukprot:g13155.t1
MDSCASGGGAPTSSRPSRSIVKFSNSMSMSRQISSPMGRSQLQLPAFADDGRPMAVFGRTLEGFTMLSYPAPLSPLHVENHFLPDTG